jgi:putative SOS response-associated peptidase YedK
MCNLYSVLSTRAEIARMADAAFDYNGNAGPMAGIYPDNAAPVIMTEDSGRRVIRDLRWGMPSSSQAIYIATEKRANALRAKGKEVDFQALLKVEPDRGTTNVRNTTSKTTGKINAHWGRWLGPGSRCLVPFTSFAEPDQDHEGTRQNIWFALDEARPLAFFAGIWTSHGCVRMMSKGWEEIDVYAFLTTDSAEPVKTFHQKAMPVILTEPAEWAEWMSDKPWEEVAHLQRPLPDVLQIVARGGKSDPAGDKEAAGPLI